MIRFRAILFPLLILYSGLLLYIEGQFGQAMARHFFTDIDGVYRSPLLGFPFYGINTTLNAFGLWATTLVFVIGLSLIDPSRETQEKRFFLSQIVMFAYFGFDDRFMLHESLYRGDLILAGLGGIELCCLIFWGQVKTRSPVARRYLYLGVLWATLMLAVDFLLPSHLIFRLSAEDLSKLWGTVYLFLFAWELVATRIRSLKDAQYDGNTKIQITS